MLYQDRLLRLYALHTWDSIGLFHFLFYKSRVYQGTDDPIMWRQVDTTLENETLIRREISPTSDLALEDRTEHKPAQQIAQLPASTHATNTTSVENLMIANISICVAFVRKTIRPRAATRLQVQPAQLIRTISPLEEEGSDTQTFSITLLNRFHIL